MTDRFPEFRAVAMDLDGTLVDSLPDLAAAAQATLQVLRLPDVPERTLRTFVGDGIDRMVERALSASLSRLPAMTILADAIAQFREIYRENLFERSRVYPGVTDGLEAMRRSGLALCCVTNKSSALAVPLLEAAGLAAHFDTVHCADTAERRKPGPALLREACRSLGVEPESLLMVGDSRHDVGAARAAGCAVVAVDYGYDSAVARSRPDRIVATFADVTALVVAPRRYGGIIVL